MKRLEKLRRWMIIKLGGYVKKPDEHIRLERISQPTHKVCAMAQYVAGCPSYEIKREVSKALANEIVKMGFVKYEYSDDLTDPYGRFGVVRATITVMEV